jgi:hypothetical protein
MKKHILASCGAALALVLAVTTAQAKLPAPSDEAKAKAAEAAAKTAHGNKVASFQLCQSMDQVAATYFAQAKKEGKPVKPADAGAAVCADPGPFVYLPPVPASGAASAAVAAAPAAPASLAPKK